MRVCFWILIFILGCVRTAKRDFRILFDDIGTQIFQAGTFDRFACQIYQKNNRSYINCQMLPHRTLEELSVRAVVEFIKNNMRVMKLFDERLDGCLFLTTAQKSQKNPIINIFSRSLKRFSNFTCPFQANLSYKMENFYLDEEELPPFTPKGKFRWLAEYYINQSIITRLVIRGKVIPWP
ncbi:hypothetical protein KR009_009270 [Drosophila setifemur]|nr:hypothetical protein KR009_009270 [Drosophila setifemur]